MTDRQHRPAIVGDDSGPKAPYPLRMKGKVVKGFGRGSAELGIPTANLTDDSILDLLAHADSGIYFGFGQVVFSSGGEAIDKQVHPMVMSVGWNPYYKNEKRSAEVHIMHKFHSNFYDQELRILVLGYVRPELDYVSVEALIKDINTDIKVSEASLARETYNAYRKDSLFENVN